MGNLLSLHPKIHRLGADTEKNCCLPYGQRNLFGKREGDFPNGPAGMEGEALDIHTRLYELLRFCANEQESIESPAMRQVSVQVDGLDNATVGRDLSPLNQSDAEH